MTELNYSAIVDEFIATRDVAPLRAVYDEPLRDSFEEFMGRPVDTGRFLDDLFDKLKTEPYTGGHGPNWIYAVFAPMAEAAKRGGAYDR